MDKSSLVRKEIMACPLCNKIHELEERKREACTIINGTKVTYIKHYLFCENSDEYENEFETGSMLHSNLVAARLSYELNRKKGMKNETSKNMR